MVSRMGMETIFIMMRRQFIRGHGRMGRRMDWENW
jgi:hypothetical protein